MPTVIVISLSSCIPRSRETFEINSLMTSSCCMSLPIPILPKLHTSPCNFYIFGPFKKALKGHTFTSYDNLHKIVVQWFRQQTKRVLCRWSMPLLHQWHFSQMPLIIFSAVPSPVSSLRQASVVYASYFEHFQVTWYCKRLEILLTNTKLVCLNRPTLPLPTHHIASNSPS